MRTALPCVALLVCLSASIALAEDKFTPLFNGKDLEGWNGDPDLWKVENGTIVGSTDNKELKHNSFLATKKTYKNFVLKAKFKLRNHNSGIQYRSKQGNDFVVTGYQADIADNDFLGILYDEGGSRGIIVNVDPKEVIKHVNKGDWNEYVITADGPHLKQELNGFTTVDYTDKDPKAATEGIIAFQLHAGPKMQVEFKDVEIRELP